MSTHPTRRKFLQSAAGLLATGVLAHVAFGQETKAPPPGVPKAPPKPPALPPEKVQATVGQAHRSLEKVRELVEEFPLLANASWDWGGGDFETPLQAAAHTGGHAIAEYLLSKNARIDLYAAAMLGQLDFIKAAFALNPNVHLIPGPHGFTMLHCARESGAVGKPVLDWMLAQGVPDVNRRPLPWVWPAGTGPDGPTPAKT